MPWLLTAVFCISGAAALVYEVAWVRMLANSLGASSYTVGTVLAAWMGGLALGAWVIGKRADRDARPLRTYARLEAGIALCAVAMPFAFDLLSRLETALYPILEGRLWALTAFRSVVAFIVLLVPTALMGATFPAMAAAVAGRDHDSRGWRIGLLYGANTLGAVGGVLVAAFVMIGRFGLRKTTFIAAGVNLAAALIAFWLASGEKERQETAPAAPEPDDPSPSGEARLALFAAAAAGFVALGFEVLWTRMFSVLFASVTYSFALMLATFLLGIALGGPIFGRLADRSRSRLEFAGVLQLLVAVVAVAVYLLFPWLKTSTGTTALAFGGPTWGQYLRSLATDAATIMLLPSFLMGGILPVVTRVLAQGPARGLASRLGRVYAANTAGAMAGSLLTGFVLIPAFGDFGRVSIFLGVGSALAGALLLFRGGQWQPLNRWLVTGVAGVAVGLLVAQPAYGRRILVERTVLKSADSTRIWYEEGPSLTVTVIDERKTGDRIMYTDAFAVAGTGDTYEYMRMIAHLPMLLNPSAKSACCVGLGTGTTAGALSLWPLDRLDIVELCPEVARATPYFAKANRDIISRINTDPRVRLVFDDGKAFLRSTRTTYDIIVAEPLNPHMSGAASLYSRDFYRVARARLNPGGIVTQWIPLHGVKNEDFRSLFSTFLDVFPESAAWYFKEAILLTGHRDRFRVNWPTLKEALDRPQTQAELIPISLADPYTLLACFVCGPKALKDYCRYEPVITDDLPTIEYFRPGRPLAFAERANLDGLMQKREQIPAYVSLEGLEAQVAKIQWKYFNILIANHFMARSEFIAARLLQIDADIAKQARDLKTAAALERQAREKLLSAERLAPGDRYVKASLAWYEEKTGERTPRELTPELADQILRMSESTPNHKIAACQLLAKFADPASGAILVRLLSDPDETVRMEAARALGDVGKSEAATRSATDPLASGWALRDAMLRERESIEFRRVCVDSLRRIGPKAASYLLSLFPLAVQAGSTCIEARLDAIAAWREFNNEDAVGYLVLVVSDPDSRVRGEAIVSLANSRHPQAVRGLLEGLKDPMPVIRQAAAEGLKRITKTGLEWKPDADPDVRGKAALAWERWFDDYDQRRRWAAGLLTLDYVSLEVLIDDVAREAGPAAAAAWEKAKEHYRAFSDPGRTPDPTTTRLRSPETDAFFEAAGGHERLWLAAIAVEARVAAFRQVPAPVRTPPLPR
ncbi:MAG: fused MFS/spermidine synthase [Candidatus Brocadiae bacterium]|nr:fused MFS/spermidine synthase [Candidatus Brocadiia bacterium]